MRGEAEPQDTAPADGELGEADADPLPALDWTIAEEDSLAEALGALGLEPVAKDATILAILVAELQGWMGAEIRELIKRRIM